MNYYEWSKEYMDTANLISEVINRLKSQRRTADTALRKELDLKISKFRTYYYECLSVSNHLLARHNGEE